MKKQLLCTSALVIGAMAAPAIAQEWDLDVHGYFNQHVGYASNDFDAGNAWGVNYDDGDYDEAVVFTNAEIHFTPSITLDNGLTFGVNVQLEANNTGGDDIDESYMYISGERFGKLIIGSENSAGYLMMVGAPSVTSMAINSPSVSAFVPFSFMRDPFTGRDTFNFRRAAISSYTEVYGNNDVKRITYFTPSFNGFMLGVSYAPSATAWTSGSGNNGVFDRKQSLNDVVDFGASYNQSFGMSEVSIAARYGFANWGSDIDKAVPNSDNPETWGVGAQYSYNGFTIGGSYAENDNGGLRPDENGWSLGVTYAAPNNWSFEASTYQGKVEYKNMRDAKYQAYKIGASYEVGPGVDWDIYGVYVDSHNGARSKNFANDRSMSVEGFGLGTAINLKF